jgi:hypothetical protein
LRLLAAPLLLALGVAAAGLYAWSYSGRVYPGVSALGVELHGHSLEAATAALEARSREMQARPVRVEYEGVAVQASLADLGVGVDAGATAREALRVGRSGNPIKRWGHMASSWLRRPVVAPHTRADHSRVAAALAPVMAQIERPAVEAALWTTHEGPAFTRSRTGRTLDLARTTARLTAALRSPGSGVREIAPAVRVIQPRVATAHLERALTDATIASGRPLVLLVGGRGWVLRADEVTAMLSVEGKGAAARATLAQAPLRRWIEGVARASGARNLDIAETARNLQVAAFGADPWTTAALRSR